MTKRNRAHRPQVQGSRASRTPPAAEKRPGPAPHPKVADVAVISAVLLAVYSATMPIVATMEDSGEFITSAAYLGLPHPPGYPLVTTIGKLFSELPFGSLAWRIHLMNALFAIGACIFVYSATLRWTRDRPLAVAAAIALGFSRTFWSQAIIAEVYSLNAFFFFALFYMCVWMADAETDKPSRWVALGLCYGLSLCNSWPLIILASGAFPLLLWPKRRLWLGGTPWLLVAVVAGLTPYVLLIPYSRDHVSFFGPVRTLNDVWNYALRQDYALYDVQPLANWWHKTRFAGQFLRMVATEFSPVGFIFIAIGAWSARRLPWHEALALAASLMSSSLLLLLVWHVEFDGLQREAYGVFQLVPLGCAAWLAALGVQDVARWAARRWPHQGEMLRTRAPAAGLFAVALAAFAWNVSGNSLRSDTFAYDFGRDVLESLPADSVLILWGDADVGPVAYAHLGERVRPDVTLTSQMGILFEERIFDFRSVASASARAEATVAFVNRKLAAGTRVFSTRRLVFEPYARRAPFKYIQHGLYYEISEGEEPALPDPGLMARGHAFLDKVTSGAYKHQWQYYRGFVLQHYCRLLAQNGETHPLFASDFDCQMALVGQWFEVEHRYLESYRLLEQVLPKTQELPLRDRSEFLRLLLMSRALSIDSEKAPNDGKVRMVQEVVDETAPFMGEFPECGNTYALTLLDIRRQIPIVVDLGAMERMFGRCPQHRQMIDAIRKGE